MLDDRYYMRQAGFNPRRSATVIIIVVNVVALFLQMVARRFGDAALEPALALSVDGLRQGYVWEFVTFQFLHVGLLHLFFNCWAIYVFGRDVEDALGVKRFLTLYFGSGVFGGMIQVMLGLLFGAHFDNPVMGASAGAFGLVAAFAVLFPDRVIMLFFIIPVRARYLLLLAAVLALFGIVGPADSVAHGAHLGGMVLGVIYVKYGSNWTWPQIPRPRARSPRKLVKVLSSNPAWTKDKEQDLPPEEFLSKEVDPILDKISAHGIQSLTERERRILEAARQKMGKR